MAPRGFGQGAALIKRKTLKLMSSAFPAVGRALVALFATGVAKVVSIVSAVWSLFLALFHTLDPLKIVASLCLAFAVFVIVPDQSLELYRYTALSLANSYNSHFEDAHGFVESIILILSVSLISGVFLVLASYLSSLHSRQNQNGAAADISTFVFSLVACIPSLAVSIGLLLAKIDTRSLQQLKSAMLEGASISFEKDFPPESAAKLSDFEVNSQLELNWWLGLGAIILLLLSAAFFLASYLFFKSRPKFANARTGGTPLIVFGFGLPILLSVVFVLFPIALARAMSTFGVICLFFAVVALFMAALSLLETRVRMPLLFLLILCAIVFNILGWNDNHGVRQLAFDFAEQTATLPPLTIGDGFTQWLKQRKDLERYETYPVYVVAAEGGGIYAAYRTATFLTSIQDLCPRVSHHLFAISSVSGGSVGAVIFSGLIQKIKQSDERFSAGAGCTKTAENAGGLFFTDVAEEILTDDFLSPVLAAFLFPDFLQRFLFFPIPQFDRSIALEKSFEASWDEKTRDYHTRFPDKWIDDKNPLRNPFTKSWSPESDSPALFINTTEVESGRGRVIAPFVVDTEELSSFPLFRTLGGAQQGHVDISMSTAAVLSARFPWLTPPGSFQMTVANTSHSPGSTAVFRQKVQLVDGGYLDNSGVITALDIVREIETAVSKMKPRQKVQINLIILASGDFANPTVIPADYLAPVQVLLSTRVARGAIAIRQAERLFKERPINSLGKVVLQGYGYPLPLGWRLSPITRLLILGQNGNLTRCSENVERPDCLMYKELNR
jgi:hypothetical protein